VLVAVSINETNSFSNSAWPATQNAHPINVQRHFPDHSSAHFVPGNPHNTTINATQYQATYGGNPTSNYHAQAPRRDNPLAIDHGIQRCLNSLNDPVLNEMNLSIVPLDGLPRIPLFPVSTMVLPTIRLLIPCWEIHTAVPDPMLPSSKSCTAKEL
jgi:hypothetical protein